MQRMFRNGFVAFVSLWFLSSLATTSLAQSGFGDEDEKDQKKTEKKKKEPKVTYAVVLVGEELQVVKSSEIQSLKKQHDEEHKSNVSAYKEARKAAKKNKEEFTEKLPKRKPFKILANGLPSEEKANEKQVKLEEKLAKKKKKKEDIAKKREAKKQPKPKKKDN